MSVSSGSCDEERQADITDSVARISGDAEIVRLAIWGNVAGEEARAADDALSRICIQARRVVGLERALADECANSYRLSQENQPRLVFGDQMQPDPGGGGRIGF